MVSEKLRSVNTALNELLGRVDPDSAEVLRSCRRNLDDAAELSEALENGLVCGPDASHGTLTKAGAA